MNLKKIDNIVQRFKFEAPVLSAASPLGMSGDEEIRIKFLDLNSYLISNIESAFLIKVTGNSMKDMKIFPGDILIVDNAENPKNGSIVVASVNGEITVKTLRKREDELYLVAANKKFLPLKIAEWMEFKILGVVKHVIHDM